MLLNPVINVNLADSDALGTTESLQTYALLMLWAQNSVLPNLIIRLRQKGFQKVQK